MWPLRFACPLALALVPVAAVAWFVWPRRLGGACAFAAAACLAVALARPQRARPTRRVARLYVLDVSGSMFADLEGALGAIRTSMGRLRPDDRAGLILVGAEAMVALPPTDVAQIPDPLKLPPELPRADGTALAAAIRLAARQVGEAAYDRQAVLFSDGRGTRGQAAAEAAVAADAGLRLFVFPVGPANVRDARVALLKAPSHVRAGEPFDVVAELAATAPLEAQVALERDGHPLDGFPRAVSLGPAARRRVVAAERPERPGFHTYTARLIVRDRCAANDQAQAAVHVEGAVRVLCLTKKGAESSLTGLLRKLDGLEVMLHDPTQAPLGETALAAADCLVLDGVPAGDIQPAEQRAIRDWVRDSCGGLVAIGGPASYGPGGYAGTPIEEALPVLCQPPRLLLVVLDRSGSMGEPVGGRAKILYARDALLEGVRLLAKTDQFALLTFAATATLRVAPGPVPSTAELDALLGKIHPDGPTELQATLDRALEVATKAQAELCHVVLVTDGQVVKLDVDGLKAAFRRADVALSVLMTGQDRKARALLERLAGLGFHHVGELSQLARVFRTELHDAVSRRLVQQGAFAVRPGPSRELSRGVAVGPSLTGYVRTFGKSTAEKEWVTTTRGDPVLARWRWGLGRAVAFASTVGTSWDEGLWPGDAAATLWKQAVQWAARPARTPGFEAEVAERAERFVVTVRAEKAGRFLNGLQLEAHVAPPKGGPSVVPLPQTAPGEYRAAVPAPAQGIYRVTVVERPANEPEGRRRRLSLGLVRNYPREWEAFGIDHPALERLARNGQGRILASIEEVDAIPPRETQGYVDLDWAALAAALALFVAEVALAVLRSRRVEI